MYVFHQIRDTKSLFLIITLIFFISSCLQEEPEKDNYPKKEGITFPGGIPKDSNTQYLPSSLIDGNKIFKSPQSNYFHELFSLVLYEAHEFVLYNNYLGHDIYRLTILPSHRAPIIICLHKDGTKVWITAKQLSRYPELLILHEAKLLKEKHLPNGKTILVDDPNWKDSIIYPNRHAEIKVKNERQLGLKHWRKFEKLIECFNFWNQNPTEKDKPYVYVDGTDWILEGHLKTKYWFVDRHNPQSEFKDCGDYLIDQSKLKLKRKYY